MAKKETTTEPSSAILQGSIPQETRKLKKARKPSARRTTHKKRSNWFQSRTAWPQREAPIGHLISEKTKKHQTMPNEPGTRKWKMVGPSNIGGRMTSVVTHPSDADQIWAGAAGGGVHHSSDGGETWTSLWHDEESINIGALAIDAKNPKVLYCGTGEANLSLDSYAGAGLYRSTDSGQNWTHLVDAKKGTIPTRIGSIAIDPEDSKHLFLGGVAFGNSEPSGLFESKDGGKTWAHVKIINNSNHWCHQVLFHPTSGNIAYATITEQGSRSGIYRTTNGGKTWKQMVGGLPPSFLHHRTSLDICRDDPAVLYALIADARTRGDTPLGVFRSDDGGGKWEALPGIAPLEERQMSYNNTIAVHPEDPDFVIWGGVDLHRSTDGGESWHTVTHWWEDVGNPHYAHADHHRLHIPEADPDRIYTANDGGLDASYDFGRSWYNLSNGLAITMFYDLDVSQLNSDLFGGGAQDNGSPITVDGQPDTFFDITGGDGGWTLFDPRDVNHIFASIYNMNIFRFRAGVGWVDVSPQTPPGEDPDEFQKEKDFMWMVRLTMHPAKSDVVYTGSVRMFRTEDDGLSWQPISGVLDDSRIMAIEVAAKDPKRIYVGTENGGIFRSTDEGRTWEGDLASSVLPGRSITRLATKPTNAKVVYATVANTGHSHVYRSDDGGDTWIDIDDGQLPDVPFNSLAVNKSKSNTVYACSDTGVYVSDDLGKTWKNLTRNLPNTNIVDLVYHEKDKTLSAATYGRSIWRIKL